KADPRMILGEGQIPSTDASSGSDIRLHQVRLFVGSSLANYFRAHPRQISIYLNPSWDGFYQDKEQYAHHAVRVLRSAQTERQFRSGQWQLVVEVQIHVFPSIPVRLSHVSRKQHKLLTFEPHTTSVFCGTTKTLTPLDQASPAEQERVEHRNASRR